MSEHLPERNVSGTLAIDRVARIDRICDEFESEWERGTGPLIETFLATAQDEIERRELLKELLLVEWELLASSGETIPLHDYQMRFPDNRSDMNRWFRLFRQQHPGINTPKHPEDVSTLLNPQAVQETHNPHGSRTPPLNRKPVRTFQTGQFGDYELLEELARGGMGVVYKARQVKLNRLVAFKMILSGHLASQEEVQRFYSEAKAAAALDHPHIVPIYEVGEREGEHFFTMGFIEGESLQQKLLQGPLPPQQAARLMVPICDAVSYAHEQGIIHRDLKPGNVLLDRKEEPHVTDFGLAKVVEDDSHITATGQVIGTPSYMPPEQARGNTSQIGAASDVYSLGAILYTLLAGHPPFQAATVADTLMQVLNKEPVPLRQINPLLPVDLETISLKCLQKEIGKRYATAAEVKAEVQRFLRGEPIHARPITRLERAWRWCRKNQLLTTAGLIAAVLAVSLFLTIISSNRSIKQALANQKTATEEAQDALHQSLSQQAKTLAVMHRQGWRDDSLHAIRQAWNIKPAPELQDLAAQTLLSWDWRKSAPIEIPRPATALQLGSDNRSILSVTCELLQVVDRETGEASFTWRHPNGEYLTECALVSDLAEIACGDVQGTLHLISTDDQKPDRSMTLFDSAVQSVVTLKVPGTETVWVAATDGIQLKVINPEKLSLVYEDVVSEEVTNRLIMARQNAPQKKQMQLEQAKQDFAPRVEALSLEENQTRLTVSPDGKLLVAANSLLCPRLWGVHGSTQSDSGLNLKSYDLDYHLPAGPNSHVTFSRDSRYLYLACNEPRWGGQHEAGILPTWRPRIEKRFFQQEPGVPAAPEGPEEEATPAPPGLPSSQPEIRQERIDPSQPKQYDPSQVAPPSQIAPRSQIDPPSQQAAPGESTPRYSKEPVISEPPRTRSPEIRLPGHLVMAGPLRRTYIYALDTWTGTLVSTDAAKDIKTLRIGAVLNFQRAGDNLFLIGSSGEVRLYRTAAPELELIGAWTPEEESLLTGTCSEDGRHCVLSSRKNLLEHWELIGPDYSSYLRSASEDSAGEMDWCTLAMAPRTELFAIAPWGSPLELRSMVDGQTLALSDQRYIRCLTWDHDGSRLLAVTPYDPEAVILGSFQYLRVLELPANSQASPAQFQSSEPVNLGFSAYSLAVHPAGNWYACGGRDSGIHLLDGNLKKQHQLAGNTTILSLQFDPTGQLLIAADIDGKLHVWDTETWELVESRQLRLEPGMMISTLAMDPEGETLGVLLSDGRLLIVSPETLRIRHELPLENEPLSLSFRGEEGLIVVGDKAGYLTLIDSEEGTIVARWGLHERGVIQTTWRNQGQSILTATLSGEVRSWNLDQVNQSAEEFDWNWKWKSYFRNSLPTSAQLTSGEQSLKNALTPPIQDEFPSFLAQPVW